MNIKSTTEVNIKEVFFNPLNFIKNNFLKTFSNFSKINKFKIEKTLETPYNKIGNIFNNLIIRLV